MHASFHPFDVATVGIPDVCALLELGVGCCKEAVAAVAAGGVSVVGDAAASRA